MSSKATVLLTSDGEHWYEKTNEPYYEDYPNGFKGFAVILELSKDSVDVIWNDDDDIVIRVAPGSELHKAILSLKNK